MFMSKFTKKSKFTEVQWDEFLESAGPNLLLHKWGNRGPNTVQSYIENYDIITIKTHAQITVCYSKNIVYIQVFFIVRWDPSCTLKNARYRGNIQ